ncbi:serine/threonine-protein kinase [Piscinibacter defluvii]|uniref:serine/threonine-protein kinase n=1 Tax=Piscinibacter defluvii TaxID=1796922 RepID=UPI000FDE642A|nr:serine/threonine-protein kinase [Piscinibacter defluvii]
MTATPDAERLKRVNRLLDEALALAPAERVAWLERLPAEQADLRPLLGALLSRAGVETDTFLQRPLRLDLPALDAAEADEDRPGDVIGPYRLLRPLGAGGMSTVWVAERIDGSLQRQEALKLPARLWAPGLARRMVAERDILAGLEHPHIARLYDAGITPAGRPWLAMELVDGEPIDRHCATHRIDLRARLRLVLQVADAVAHAHARLVVHRDLKPSNILVTPAGEVRLLDFGVAKLLAPDDAAAPAGGADLTRLLGRPVTPDYAAPEQVAGRPVGVAADVYSLGVVLYELLTGQRPYRIAHVPAAALERAVLEAEVPPASSRAADRATARALRGDLDTILAKALKKAPAERYLSIEAFAADLQRHLAGEPVQARPDSLAYRGAKWLRRHRVVALAGLFVALAIAAGVAGTLSQARRAQVQAQEAQAQRDRALQELAYAESADELMRFLLSEGAERPFTTRELLQRAQAQVERQFADDPRLRARLLLMLADLHGEMDDFRSAERLLEQARAASTDAEVRAQVDCTLAGLLAATSRIDAARALFERTVAALPAASIGYDPARLTCWQQRTILHAQSGDAAAALADAEAALALIGPQPRPGLRTVTIFLHTSVGDAQALLGRPQEAIAAYERAIAEFERIGRGNTTAAATLANNLGVHLARAGQPGRAAQVYARALAAERPRSRGRDAALLTNAGRNLVELGRADEAVPLLREALAQHQAKGDTRGAAFAQLGLASADCSALAPARCEAALAEAERALRQAVAPGHPVLAGLPLIAARAALAQGDAARARRLADPLAGLTPTGRDQALALTLLARADLALGDGDTARRHADAAVAAARAAARGFAHTEALGQALLAQALARRATQDAAGARDSVAAALAQLEDSAGVDAAATREARALREALSTG